MDGLGQERRFLCMSDTYIYTNTDLIKSYRSKINKILGEVTHELKATYKITFSFNVGSGGRNMVTEIVGGNEGFDLDCNIKVKCLSKNQDASKIRKDIMNAFAEHSSKYGFSPSQDKTRVFRIQIKDREASKIIFGCDFAILRESVVNGKKKTELIHFDKKSQKYVWNDMTEGYKTLEKEEMFCKQHDLWQDVRDEYLVRKAKYGHNKESIYTYIETVDVISKQNGYK